MTGIVVLPVQGKQLGRARSWQCTACWPWGVQVAHQGLLLLVVNAAAVLWT